MASFVWILIFGVPFIVAGFALGSLFGHRILRDIPDVALVGGGFMTALLGYFALVSYLGFLFYPPGLLAFGVGVGKMMRRLATSE